MVIWQYAILHPANLPTRVTSKSLLIINCSDNVTLRVSLGSNNKIFFFIAKRDQSSALKLHHI